MLTAGFAAPPMAATTTALGYSRSLAAEAVVASTAVVSAQGGRGAGTCGSRTADGRLCGLEPAKGRTSDSAGHLFAATTDKFEGPNPYRIRIDPFTGEQVAVVGTIDEHEYGLVMTDLAIQPGTCCSEPRGTSARIRASSTSSTRLNKTGGRTPR